MKRYMIYPALLFLCLLLIPVFNSEARADNEPIEVLLSAVIRESYPDCQIFDYAPIGPEKTEYIVLTQDSEEKTAVMIVNTEQPAVGVGSLCLSGSRNMLSVSLSVRPWLIIYR